MFNWLCGMGQSRTAACDRHVHVLLLPIASSVTANVLRPATHHACAAAPAQVIPIGESGQLAEAFNIRLEELNVIDLKFLHGCAKPTLALLHQDPKNARHLRTYVVDLKAKARASPFCCLLVEEEENDDNLFSYSSGVAPSLGVACMVSGVRHHT